MAQLLDRIPGYKDPQIHCASTVIIVGTGTDIVTSALRPSGPSEKLVELVSCLYRPYFTTTSSPIHIVSLNVARSIGTGLSSQPTISQRVSGSDSDAGSSNWKVHSAAASDSSTPTGMTVTKEDLITRLAGNRLLTNAGEVNTPDREMLPSKMPSICMDANRGFVFSGNIANTESYFITWVWREWYKDNGV